ncbi:MAG: hypothetical protein MJ252_09530 [archaeon]|nr:hypothetical protein [archaeon]
MEVSSTIDMYKQDIAELDSFISQSKRPNIKRQLEQYRTNIQFLLSEEEKKAAAQKENTEKKETKPKIDTPNFLAINKYALDTSSNNFVKIYLTDGFEGLKTHDSKNIQSRFSKNAFMVCILNWKQKNYRFACMNLCNEIVPEKSYTKATNSGLIIYLSKVKSTDVWDTLEKKKSLLTHTDGLKDKSKDPSESLMDMMKDMYNNGDPELKRAMVK